MDHCGGGKHLEWRRNIDDSGMYDDGYMEKDETEPCQLKQSDDGDAFMKSDDCFKIAQEINTIYEERVNSLSSSDKGKDIKIAIFDQWVKDLREQNDNLTHVVTKLEQDFMKQCMNCCEMEQFHQKRIEDLKKMLSFKEKIIERQKNFLDQMRNYKCLNQNKANQKSPCGTNNQVLKSNCQSRRGTNDDPTKYVDQDYDEPRDSLRSDNNECSSCKSRRNNRRELSRDTTKLNELSSNNNQKDEKVMELTAQLEMKEKLISNLQDKLRTFKCMPMEIKPLTVKIKEFVQTMNDILRKSSNEDLVMKMLTCLECISLCLNELQLIVDNYKDNQREQMTQDVGSKVEHPSMTEIFRRKNTDSSASTINNDMKQLMKEVHDQEAVIDCLRNALADAQEHIKCLNASNFALKQKNEFGEPIIGILDALQV